MPYLTTRKNLKLQLSPGLVASYDIQPGNGVGLFCDTTHTPDPHGGYCPSQLPTDGYDVNRCALVMRDVMY